MTKVNLKEMSVSEMERFWSTCSEDTAWPLQDHSLAAFQSFVETWQAREALGWGGIRTVLRPVTAEVIGFITFEQIEEHFLTPSVRAVECGTYLKRDYRGKGYNHAVKAATTVHAFKELQAEYVVYAVPVVNEPAKRSLRRILKNEAPQVGEMFQRWLKHREWKEGRAFELFIVDLKTAESCNLLDPDGDDNHFIGQE